jgi:4a-hydroxytetrahydrobiopterin dehydratase
MSLGIQGVHAVAALAAMQAAPQHTEQAFTSAQIDAQLVVLPDWSFVHGKIVKTFRFGNYFQTIAFVNVVAAIAHRTDHHPDLSVHFNRCEVAFNTHDVEHGKGGISINDFICAARIETAHSLI